MGAPVFYGNGVNFGAIDPAGVISMGVGANICRWVGATESPSENFGAFVGADIIRPVVFLLGKQRRRKAPTMQYEHFAMKFGGIISKHGAFGNIVTFPGQFSSAQKFATLAGG